MNGQPQQPASAPSETGTPARTAAVAVSGASGLIGAALVADLERSGVTVLRLSRQSTPDASSVAWDPARGLLQSERVEGVGAVVHLAGESIGNSRWTAEKKRRIRDSRVEGTRQLCRSLTALNSPPRVLVCASAIGFYGDRGDELLDESSPPGTGFLPEVCREWEEAAQTAADAGTRVVQTRFGVVLSRHGGALQKMLPPFRLGAGGRIGSGRQYWSWVALPDVVGAVRHAIDVASLSGPLNVVAPHPVTNAEFTKVLARLLHRPALFPVPAAAARLALGEMADDLLLASARVVPRKLESSGYTFRYPALEEALRHALSEG